MVPVPSSPTDRPVAGISLCVFGLFPFSLQDVIIKSFSDFRRELRLRRAMGEEGMLRQTVAIAKASTGFPGDEIIPAEERSS
jgi:hypothetical protein